MSILRHHITVSYEVAGVAGSIAVTIRAGLVKGDHTADLHRRALRAVVNRLGVRASDVTIVGVLQS